ncbi:MAG TPA: TonB-dependent receptor [Rudaea sp.]|jgi:outer membrane receptor protein involved in Fe transport
MNIRFALRKRLLASVIGAAVAGAALGPSPGWAQTADATLRGKAPPDMQITAKNVATGALRHTNSAADGSYALVGLPPGTYTVNAGPGTEKTVTLTVASTSTLDFGEPTPAPTTTTTLAGVSVTASTLGEVKTSEVGNTISLHQINTVPQITRNFLEFADTVPGMAFEVDSSGHTSLRGGAQNTNSVNVYIDGVGQKNYVKEGGVSGQFFSQGNPFPQLAIGEYKVITSNYKAEYDQISSAAVTAETKSGTNDFHGETFGQYTDDGWRDMTPGEKAAGKKTQSHEREYGVALGGPIIQDTMHFFLSYEAKRYDTPITVAPGVIGINDLLPPDAIAQAGPADLPFIEDLYFGKIDWELTDRDRIEVSSKVRKETQRDNVGGTTAASSGIDVVNNDTRIDARWQHSADAWYNELLFTWQKVTNAPTALTVGNGSVYEWVPQNNARILYVGGADAGATQDKSQKGPGIKDDLTFNNLNWMGDHTVKLGVKYQEVKLLAQDASPTGNPVFFYDVTPDGASAIPYRVLFPTPVPGLTPTARSSNKQFGTYIQDDWAINDKLTLNLGVRWDYEETPSYLNYVTPAGVAAGLQGPYPSNPGVTYAQALAAGGININEYISNGHNRSAPKNEWQPRLGFSYDLDGDEEHVVFGGIGRAYDRDLYDYLQVELTKAALPLNTIFFNDSSRTCTLGPTCVEWDPKYFNGLGTLQPLLAGSNAGQEVDLINNNLKVPYSDQFSIGMRNKLWDWNTSAAIQRIVSKDGFVFTLGNRYPDGSFWKNGCQPWCNVGITTGVPGYGNLILGSNGIETRSTQVLLSADKPYTKESGWGVTLAYTYTHATQNRSITEHYAFDEASIQQYPFVLSNAAPKHRFVATGSLDGFWGITFGGKLTLATPTPLNDQACVGITTSSGAPCVKVGVLPNDGTKKFLVGGNIFGYRSIDFQATKNFDLTHGMSVYVRFDLLNALNYKNYSDYSVRTWGGNGVLAPDIAYNTTGNISGVPRTFKLSAGFRW